MKIVWFGVLALLSLVWFLEPRSRGSDALPELPAVDLAGVVGRVPAAERYLVWYAGNGRVVRRAVDEPVFSRFATAMEGALQQDRGNLADIARRRLDAGMAHGLQDFRTAADPFREHLDSWSQNIALLQMVLAYPGNDEHRPESEVEALMADYLLTNFSQLALHRAGTVPALRAVALQITEQLHQDMGQNCMHYDRLFAQWIGAGKGALQSLEDGGWVDLPPHQEQAQVTSLCAGPLHEAPGCFVDDALQSALEGMLQDLRRRARDWLGPWVDATVRLRQRANGLSGYVHWIGIASDWAHAIGGWAAYPAASADLSGQLLRGLDRSRMNGPGGPWLEDLSARFFADLKRQLQDSLDACIDHEVERVRLAVMARSRGRWSR
jgi:hypothetical protein